MHGLQLIDDPFRFRHIELEINTACDLACFGCDRMSDVASKGVPNMTVEQVRLFVDESLELGWEWERIRLLGGEPTIHPQFRECLGELLRYRNEIGPTKAPVFLQVLTNGLGKADKYREFCNSNGVSLHAESKQKGVDPAWFWNTRITPVDRDPSVGELPPCAIFGVRGCGIGLTRHGYFLDGAGASAARVAGHDIGLMSLKEVTWDRMMDQSKVLCRICGQWNPTEGPIVTELVKKTGRVTGPYWQNALDLYQQKKPELRVYGVDR